MRVLQQRAMLSQGCYALLINVVVLLHILQQVRTVKVVLVACVHKAIMQQESFVWLLAIADCSLHKKEIQTLS